MSRTSAVVVVVPDGLEAPAVATDAPARVSFVYKAVLDHVMEAYVDRHVLLAPANHFGGTWREQDAARHYIGGRISHLTVPPGAGNSYVDTRGNARELRLHLQRTRQWPLGPVILAVAYLHARRAALCFTREGFEVASVDAVKYLVTPGCRIVSRLWYYRYPGAHRCYEVLALARDLLRTRAV